LHIFEIRFSIFDATITCQRAYIINGYQFTLFENIWLKPSHEFLSIQKHNLKAIKKSLEIHEGFGQSSKT
jgi:hypothetical protein